MPATAGIHDFALLRGGKSWMPAFAGLTRWVIVLRCEARQP